MSRRPLPGQLALFSEDDDHAPPPPVPAAPHPPEPPPATAALLAKAVAPLPWISIHDADPDPNPPSWWRENPADSLTNWVGMAIENPIVAEQLRYAISLLPVAIGLIRSVSLGGHQVNLRRDLITVSPEKVKEGRISRECVLWSNPNYERH